MSGEGFLFVYPGLFVFLKDKTKIKLLTLKPSVRYCKITDSDQEDNRFRYFRRIVLSGKTDFK